MSLPIVFGTGRLTKDPELRWTPNTNKASVSLSLAFNARRRNPQTNEWEDGDVCFLNATAWEQMAEHLGQFRKGDELVVSGRLRTEKWTDRDGQERSTLKLLVDQVGPSVRFKEARLVDTGVQRRQQPPEDPFGSAPAVDPNQPPF